MQTEHIPIWEDKGIIIGLFAYIIKNHKSLINNTIIINNNVYGSIIKLFFTKLKIKKKSKHNQNNLHFINIKNVTETDHLHINNLNNFQTIHNKKITLLPWYDKDNPIVMFHYDPTLTINMSTLLPDLSYFEKHIRYNSFNKPGLTKTNCVIDCWDTYYENKILKKFVKLYPIHNANQVNKMINDILLYPTCKDAPTYIQSQPNINYITQPDKVPTYSNPEIKYIKTKCDPEIKYIKTECKPEIKEIIKYVPAPIPIPLPGSKIEGKITQNCKMDNNLIKLINKKVEAMNNMLNHNSEDSPKKS